MRRTLVSALTTAGIAAALTVIGPVSSTSAAPTGTAACPSGYLCVWDQTGYKGHMYKFSGKNASWEAWPINNHDASWYNNAKSGLDACVWQGKNYTGSVKVIKAGKSSPRDSAHAHRGSSNSWGNC
ncbi:peptidase inhibitor family I36 protein [Streptomyces sp. NBC_01591]|uniref:peptidase inhibitor family I36 protein n=1 Tax=Streptomyces sp. NBC_01591 TaxID=2975888 RepID=UPI002DD956A0|nr:peptidase inhibitor family I36 protein [Streptomyces sp. NBC_01591]WSD66254.1 peptidase inhibitor family I36 protein [Streptomyces sp. NBC_01591]